MHTQDFPQALAALTGNSMDSPVTLAPDLRMLIRKRHKWNISIFYTRSPKQGLIVLSHLYLERIEPLKAAA